MEYEEELEEVLIPRSSSFSSLGSVGLSFYKVFNGPCIISSLQSEGSAKACGKLRAGDMIHKVDGRAVVSLTASEVTALIVGPPGSSVCFQISRSGLGPSDKIMFARQTREALIPRGDRETNNGRGALSSVGMTFAKVQHPGPFIVTWMDKAGSAYSSGLVRIGQIVHEVERRSTSLMDVEELDALLLGKPGSHVHMLLSSYVLDLNELNCIDPHVLYRSEDGDVGMEFWKGIMDGFEVLAVEPQGPADLARVRVGDVIHAVRDMSAHPLTSAELEFLIRGQPGTKLVVWTQRKPLAQHEREAASNEHDPSPLSFYQLKSEL